MKREVELVFENCECFKVECDIEFNIVRQEENFISIDNVRMLIPKESNDIYNPFGGSSETTKFNRITQHDDITQIHINGVAHYPMWYEEDEYSWSQYNDYQHTYRNDNGEVVINISSDSKKRKIKHEKILELLNEYWSDSEELTFGKLIHFINCKLGGIHIFDASDDDIIEAIEELIVEQL